MALRDLGHLESDDQAIYEAARAERVVFVTKDSDFTDLVERLGPPPYVIWLTCGNTTEKRLQEIFREHLDHALSLIREGEPLVEISA